jgi:NAD(P)-dependent dehydrogenase (short-subunit alcohol dehydrogenase family)
VLLYPTLRAEHPPVRILGYPLDAVVCCAGVLATVPEYTRECLERTLVVNYLSRYLLVRGTDHLLRGSPSGRVVLVANAGKYRDTLDLDDLQHRRHRPRLRVAGRTQFANDLFAVELAERWRDAGIQVACVYPGVVRTDVFGNARGVGATVRTLGRTVSRLVGSTPERAAFTPGSWLLHPTPGVSAGGSTAPACARSGCLAELPGRSAGKVSGPPARPSCASTSRPRSTTGTRLNLRPHPRSPSARSTGRQPRR